MTLCGTYIYHVELFRYVPIPGWNTVLLTDENYHGARLRMISLLSNLRFEEDAQKQRAAKAFRWAYQGTNT